MEPTSRPIDPASHDSGPVHVLDRVAAAIAAAQDEPDSAFLAWEAFRVAMDLAVYDRFGAVVELVAPHLEVVANDEGRALELGFAAWVADQPGLAEVCYKRALALNRGNEVTYRRLTNLMLTTQRWVDALLVAQAARSMLKSETVLNDLLPLIDLLVSDTRRVSFELDGMTFVFGLSCKNGQALEADTHHCHGLLVELDELRFLASWLPPVSRIVECGCLVGNHTVYFLKKLRPAIIDVFDASQWSLAEMARNVELNASDEMETQINCHHRAIARTSGQTIHLLGETVETITLIDAIADDADFVKVDIDGMELESLDGLLEGLQRSQARLMIEVRSEDVPLFKQRLESIEYRLDHEIRRSVDSNLFFAPAAS